MSQHSKRKGAPKPTMLTRSKAAAVKENKRQKKAKADRKRYLERKKQKSTHKGTNQAPKQESKQPKRIMSLILSKYAKENFDDFQTFQKSKLRQTWNLYPIADWRY